MPIQPIQNPARWGWDAQSGELVVEFVQAPPADEPDPASWQPSKGAIVRFVPSSVNIHDLPFGGAVKSRSDVRGCSRGRRHVNERDNMDSEHRPDWAIRLESKLDIAITQHGARLEAHQKDIVDHEARVRAIERSQAGIDSNRSALERHEQALLRLDAQDFVTSKAMWQAMGMLLGALTALGALYVVAVDAIPRFSG